MSAPSPEHLTDKLWRATVTALATAIGLFVAGQLVRPLLPALAVLVGLLFVCRLALGAVRGRRGW